MPPVYVLRYSSLALLAVLAAGCVSDDQKRSAITHVNEAFRQDYERILEQKGTRLYCLPTTERPGLDMGRFVLDQGHRHAAYISCFPEAPFSHRRFLGCQAAFAQRDGANRGQRSKSLASHVVPISRLSCPGAGAPMVACASPGTAGEKLPRP